MNPFFEELTIEQRCAVLGFAIDFCGCEEPTQRQFEELQELLSNIHEEMAVSHEDVESYVAKMLSNGRLAYAINTLKTIKDEKIFRLFYPFFYSVVATLGSYDGLEKLDKIYNDEFGYNKEEIKLIWDLYEIRDFRKTTPRNNNTTTTGNGGGSGCMILVLSILTSLFFCLCGIVMMVE